MRGIYLTCPICICWIYVRCFHKGSIFPVVVEYLCARLCIVSVMVRHFSDRNYLKLGLKISYTMIADPAVAVIQQRKNVRFCLLRS